MNSLVESLKEAGFLHIKNIAQRAFSSPLQKKLFSSWWGDLVPDENFKEYTSRARRILRYSLSGHTPSTLTINRNSSYSSAAKYEIAYKEGVNNLTYCEEGFISDPILQAVLLFDLELCRSFIGQGKSIELDIHQFRIKSEAGAISPTTSGIHQDEYDMVFMHFVRSQNILPVISEVFSHPDEDALLFRKEMTGFLETLVIDDRQCWHRASAVRQKALGAPAWRDMLIVSCRKSAWEAPL
ncbi:2OG-Fe dioxygenase family protein [Pseudomonas japonica]|uniref:2OG-Fe dioxygenase n=1 Tax=Pseudomonas japonica TaxID=256466 RepID=A0A239I313_9PSED|nr:2OG-Fe dioxygenase family protein [Pseudomonas japonica]SNS87899.1 2OG-Fe dioxygenase [Pseudomonas japonica]